MPDAAALAFGEWGERPASFSRAGTAYGAAALGVLLLALLAAMLHLLAGVFLGIAGLAALGGFAASRGPAALDAAGARPARGSELPRVRNLVTGLAADLGAPVPALWVTSSSAGGPNALVTWRRLPVIAVTSDFEETFTRTECEAVLTHCMARIASGEARSTTLRTGFGPFGPSGREPARADLETVARTRYPPAMISALSKAGPRQGAFAALWFAPEAGGDVSVSRRADALRDL